MPSRLRLLSTQAHDESALPRGEVVASSPPTRIPRNLSDILQRAFTTQGTQVKAVSEDCDEMSGELLFALRFAIRGTPLS